MEKCEKTHVVVRDGCAMVRRIVYFDEQQKKYIKLNGQHVYLSDITGRFRYTK